MRAATSGQVFGPVGPTIQNGVDAAGARMYPWSTGLAIQPPSYFSNYIGDASGLPVAPPVSALSGTTGVASVSNGTANAIANPFGRYGIILPVIVGLFFAVGFMHWVHYSDRRRK